MADLNKVILLGNLTRDPDLRYTQGGTAICKLGLAVNRRYQTRQGEDQEEVCFVDIDVFGRQAETCKNYLQKGSPALVEGRLRLDQWEDRQSGARRSRLCVTAENVQFLGSPGQGARFGGDDERRSDDNNGMDDRSGSRSDGNAQTAAPDEGSDPIPF